MHREPVPARRLPPARRPPPLTAHATHTPRTHATERTGSPGRGAGQSHTSSASSSALPPLTLIGLPFMNAPPFLDAVYLRCTHVPAPPANSTTHAASGSEPRSTPTETPKEGYPCAKLVVPSSGSTHQRYSDDAASPTTPPSSPRMACPGNAAVMAARHAASEALSVSVTRSAVPLSVMLRGLSSASLTSCGGVGVGWGVGVWGRESGQIWALRGDLERADEIRAG